MHFIMNWFYKLLTQFASLRTQVTEGPHTVSQFGVTETHEYGADMFKVTPFM
jgi:hypothetical protein